MNIALLISGEVRTFVLKEQILFFKQLLIYLKQFYEMVDVFMVLKIPDNKDALIKSRVGLKNFKKICIILKPKYLYCFYDFNEGMHTEFNIQLKMIDMCIDNALEYQKQNNLVYNTFFRIRPDSCFLLNELENTFNRFVSKIETYKPREYILENLSIKKCEEKLNDLINNF